MKCRRPPFLFLISPVFAELHALVHTGTVHVDVFHFFVAVARYVEKSIIVCRLFTLFYVILFGSIFRVCHSLDARVVSVCVASSKPVKLSSSPL